jgi:hypothetical protein
MATVIASGWIQMLPQKSMTWTAEPPGVAAAGIARPSCQRVAARATRPTGIADNPARSNLMNLTLNLALWIAAGFLAVVFLVSSTKLFVPKEKIASIGAPSRWVQDFSPGALKAIGALELLAAVGLILPAALDIAPVLVPLAATGAVLLMVGAVITRLRRREVYVVGDLVYLVLAAFVAWGRFGPEPFTG